MSGLLLKILLLHVQLLLHLVQVGQLLDEGLVLHLILGVPSSGTLTIRASLIANVCHLVYLSLQRLLILEQSVLLPLSMYKREAGRLTLQLAVLVQESSDGALNLDRCQVLGSHRPTPRLLNYSALRCAFLPLEVWNAATSVASMNARWSSDH